MNDFTRPHQSFRDPKSRFFSRATPPSADPFAAHGPCGWRTHQRFGAATGAGAMGRPWGLGRAWKRLEMWLKMGVEQDSS